MTDLYKHISKLDHERRIALRAAGIVTVGLNETETLKRHNELITGSNKVVMDQIGLAIDTAEKYGFDSSAALMKSLEWGRIKTMAKTLPHNPTEAQVVEVVAALILERARQNRKEAN